MSIGRQDQAWRKGLWYSGKVARRRFLGLGVAAAGALGASMLVPAPWRQAFGAARPYKIGSLQPLTGPGAIAGRSALIGLEVAMQRINASGGINGRPIELASRPGRSLEDGHWPAGGRGARHQESRIDVHQGGFLSDVCLACMSIWERHKIVNMIGACLDTRITTTRCSRYSFRPFDYSPAQAVAFAPSLIKMGKRWHIIYSDYTWGQSTRDAYANEIRWRGGEIVGATAVPVGTADMRPFLQTIAGSFDGLLGIFFGQDGALVATQAYDLGLTRKYRWAGDGAIATATSLPALGQRSKGSLALTAICRSSKARWIRRSTGSGSRKSSRLGKSSTRAGSSPIALCNRTTRA
jgi:branched-chain amino acid transport system substrate-binding protein